MELKDLLPHFVTLSGVIFGFGWQGATMQRNQRDIKNIAQGHREIMDKLSKLDSTLARIDQRLLHLEGHD
jgi:hypothetical protein